MALIYDVIMNYITGGVTINDNEYLCVRAQSELKNIVKNLEYPVNVTANKGVRSCGEHICIPQETCKKSS